MRSAPWLLPLLLLWMTGCATIDNGPMQRIQVSSDVDAEVRSERCGRYSTKLAITPAVVWVSRRATRCTLEVSAPGHRAEVIRLRRFKSAAVGSYAAGLAELCGQELENCNSPTDVFVTSMFATLLFVPSIIVDAAAGSIYEQEPRYVKVTFAADPPDPASAPYR